MTVNDVVLELCAGALRRRLSAANELPAEPLLAIVPMSVRGTLLARASCVHGSMSARDRLAPPVNAAIPNVPGSLAPSSSPARASRLGIQYQ